MINNDSYGLSGQTLPSNISSASSSTVSVGSISATPSVTVPPAVSTAVITAVGGGTRTSPDGNGDGVPVPTMAQTIDALSTLAEPGAFSPSQATAAISKITSIINNVDLTPSQTAQMIQLRESLETSVNK